jgi:hypothetical protein
VVPSFADDVLLCKKTVNETTGSARMSIAASACLPLAAV